MQSDPQVLASASASFFAQQGLVQSDPQVLASASVSVGVVSESELAANVEPVGSSTDSIKRRAKRVMRTPNQVGVVVESGAAPVNGTGRKAGRSTVPTSSVQLSDA